MLKGSEVKLPMYDYKVHKTTVQACGYFGPPLFNGHSVSIYMVRCNSIDPASPAIHIANAYYLDAIYREAHLSGTSETKVEAGLFYDERGTPKPYIVRDVDCGSDVCLRRNLVQFYFAEYINGGPFEDIKFKRAFGLLTSREPEGTHKKKIERNHGQLKHNMGPYHIGMRDATCESGSGKAIEQGVREARQECAEKYRGLIDGKGALNSATTRAYMCADTNSCLATGVVLDSKRCTFLTKMLDPSASQVEKQRTRQLYPEHVTYFDRVMRKKKHWEIKGHYSYTLLICDDETCGLCMNHPKRGTWSSEEDGLRVTQVPRPEFDKERHGKYMNPEVQLREYAAKGYPISIPRPPPSKIAALVFKQLMTKSAMNQPVPSDIVNQAVARIKDKRCDFKAMFTHFERLRHVYLRRAQGALKAASTRRKKKAGEKGTASKETAPFFAKMTNRKRKSGDAAGDNSPCDSKKKETDLKQSPGTKKKLKTGGKATLTHYFRNVTASSITDRRRNDGVRDDGDVMELRRK